MKIRAGMGALSACAAVVALSAGTGQGHQPIDRMSWLAGCWAMTSGDAWYEEQWMAPRAGMMVGMARAVQSDRVVLSEATRIEERDGRLVFIAHPSGQRITEFTATDVSDSVAVFENLEHDFPQRIRYRHGAGDSLLARIEGDRNGELRGVDFRMGRVTCPGPRAN